MIDQIFARFWAWYGTLAESRWGVDVNIVKDIWAQDLGGLTLEDIKRGLLACRDNSRFPPTLPEFRAMCVGSRQKIDCEAAYQRCLQYRYACKAEYWAMQDYGNAYGFQESWQKARFRFPELLKTRLQQKAEGTLPSPPKHVCERIGWVS